MKAGVILGGFVLLLTSMFGVVFLIRGRPATESGAVEVKAAAADRPVVSKTGPHPKAVLDSAVFDFGRIELGDEGSHSFTIRNEGEAPLLLKKGPTTCQCTVSQLDHDRIEPGQSAQITLTWKPTSEADKFEKGATIWTNDPVQALPDKPMHAEFKLSVLGAVAARVMTYPIGDWGPVEAQESGTVQFTGKIISQIDDEFTITGIEIDNPLVSAEAVVIEDRKELWGDGKFGYDVKFTFQEGMPVGAFNIPFTIRTDLKHRTTGDPLSYPLILKGTRRGPITIVGKGWYEDRAVVGMGTFSKEEGKKVELTLLSKLFPPEGLKIIDSESDQQGLQVTMVQDEKSRGKAARCLLTFEYRAGSARTTRLESNPAMVKIRTNHPTAPEMQFRVMLTAY